MDCFEEKLNFIQDRPIVRRRGLSESSVIVKDIDRLISNNHNQSVLGITVRLGNAPIVKDLKKLFILAEKSIPADLQGLFDKKDVFLIAHMIGAIRLNGTAKVDELQYNAEIIESKGAQTIDLLPNTTFHEIASVHLGFEGSLSGHGNFSATIPDSLSQALLEHEVTLGADMKIQLSSNNNFVGKFTYSLKFPVIQSMGISSSYCTWVLNPHNRPLLGDQLLIQTIAVPKGTKKILYKAKGVCKADKGIFWKQRILETKEYHIEVDLE
jgi:hypothetical protein